MPANVKGVAQIRTRTGARKALQPHERYAKLCRLELEIKRNRRELSAVQRRQRQIEEREKEIAAEVSKLLPATPVPGKPFPHEAVRGKKSAVRYHY